MLMVMDWIKKVTDIIMPLEPLPEEEEEVEEVKKTPAKSAEPMQMQQQETVVRRAAAGGGGTARASMNYSAGSVLTSDNGTASIDGMRYTAYSDNSVSTPTARPSLTVVKSHDLTMKIYAPDNFDQVVGIADDILERRAAVVNYERVNADDQRRISDFVNGVCYVTDGTVSMVSEKIFLYMPNGVEAGEIARVATSMRIR